MRLGSCITQVALVLVIACHAPTRPPPQTLEQRATAALARWGNALRRGDVAALDNATDVSGRFAILYVAAKAAASHTDGGAEALEKTVVGNLLLFGLQSMWPGVYGAPYQFWYAVVPSAEPITLVPVPYDQTLGRIDGAIEEHRARLREKAAWTCRFEKLEHVVLPTEPTLLRAAEVSTFMFGGWLRLVEAVWIVRARCASGPALFAITAYRDGDAKILFEAI